MLRSEFPVLLLDDGELGDVAEVLHEIGADFAHLRGGAVPEKIHPPRDLLVTTPRRASVAAAWPPHTGGPGRPVKIVVATEDSQTARRMLRRLGYDYLVRRPVHPTALRLLLLRALYRGEEKRRTDRVPVGYEVSLRSGLRRRRGVLADLSVRGCRVVSDRSLEPGSRLWLGLPAEIAGGSTLKLRGRVVRSVESGDAFEVALAFEGLDPGSHRRLVDVVRERSAGPAVLAKGTESGPARSGGRKAPRRPRQGSERRSRRRGRYARAVVALTKDARQVLLGRDLSDQGMRVEPSPELEVGSRLRLAIYAAAGQEPLLLDATVARDDGEEGFGLLFEHVTPEVAERLERIVASLPVVEPLGQGETGSLGAVLSRIVSR